LTVCSLPTAPSASSLHFSSHATPPPDIYTLSLHDALPISLGCPVERSSARSLREIQHHVIDQSRCSHKCGNCYKGGARRPSCARDRKSTRLNSSHRTISYAVFCLKKKTTSVRRAIRWHNAL